MRALPTLLIAAASFVSAGPALAQSMANMPGMNRATTQVKTGKGDGVITAIDPKTAKLTIKHSQIPAVGWPAMTMAFRVTPPALLHGLRIGQRIGFDVRVQGMTAEVTGVRPH